MSSAQPAEPGPPRVVVIGGGIAGLAAAHRLLAGGARVTVLEAGTRLGGKLHAGELAGVPADLGAEALLARRPEAVGLARAVGLADALQPVAAGGAAVWTRGKLRPLPGGQVMGVPGDLDRLAAADVLSPEGLARVAREAELPPAEPGEDVAIGAFVAERLGAEVTDRLVEPLLGGVYAGDAYRLSMRAAVPQLFAALREERTLLGAARAVQSRGAAASASQAPVFMGIEGGVGRLPAAVAEAVREAGGEIVLGAEAASLERGKGFPGPAPSRNPGRRPGDPAGAAPPDPPAAAASGAGRPADPAPARWRVLAGGRAYDADAVVLAVPAAAAARLVGGLAPRAAAEFDGVRYASMALITLALPRREAEAQLPAGTGFLVPPVDGRTIKASTFSSAKWRWAGDDDVFLLRTSVGRIGDDKTLERDDADLVTASLDDLRAATGLAARPVASRVSRWRGALPQYEVGHDARVARIRGALPAGLAVCGALYDGVGIPACIASAHRAADELLGRPGTMTA
ncbi:protoporphyrinogen oxidase [Streptomyces sp. CMB-StM0423]|uniref:protoporphyrinogen oxidase n=1 Tax=Streptomyces sp. CMB-StM0423 TaxID=2059884 RepID=UPI000C711BE2|nr:protoporphyrinogen oxidase [Streptomyces sp. CMB-StM0423]AUH39852.1 protoporphyrinogen oxidase [Streptomyces sp. CMB-StM0423]